MLSSQRYCFVAYAQSAHVVMRAIRLVCLLLLGHAASYAQPKLSQNWYFGQNAGLTFRNGVAESVSDGRLSTSEGCASISDPNTGELLFYTDGVTVWNRLHEVMPNGRGLFGDPSTSQSALIVPAPGRPYLYYIFNAAPVTATNASSRCLCLYYSIIDMRQDDGFGDVSTKNELLLNDVTEHVTAASDCRGDSWWIIVRSRVSRHFYSLHLTRDELQSLPVISDVGNPLLQVKDAGQMHVSPDNRRLVLTSTSGHTQLFDFDGESGKVSRATMILQSPNGVAHYGAAFSLDSRLLYVAASPESALSSAKIYQFDITKSTNEQIASSAFLVGEVRGINSWIAMQLAPDGKIYVGRPGEAALSVINSPHVYGQGALYADKALRLSGVMRLGLPNIIGPTLIEPTQRASQCALPNANFDPPRVVCAGSCASFRDLSTGPIESWMWSFEGGVPSSSVERNPSRICYTKPGVYTIQLVTSNLYGADSVETTIQVEASPTLTVDSIFTVCPGEPFTLTAQGAQSYQWSPAQPLSNARIASPTAKISTTTRFTVIGTSNSGCADTATVLVRLPTMLASGDATICAGASTQLHAQGATQYSWSPTVGLDDPTSPNPVARPATSTTYTVRLTSGACMVVDTVVVHVLDSFAVNISSPALTCSADTVTLSASSGTIHEWTGQGVLDRYAPTTRVVLGTNPVDIILLAKSGDCVAYDTLHIEPHKSPTIQAGADQQICQGQPALLRASASVPNIQWITTAGNVVGNGDSIVVMPGLTTSFIAVVTNDVGCVTVDTVVIRVTPTPLINAGADISLCQGASKRLLSDGNAESIIWSPADGLDNPTITSPTASPLVTTTYVMRAQTGDCVSEDTVTVYVSKLNLKTVENQSICKGGTTHLKSAGAITYRWTPSSGLSDSTSPSPYARPDTTTTYNVVGRDALGCTQTASVTVYVRDTIPITLIAGSITASAGEDSIGIPVYIEVPPESLPLHVDDFRATLVHDATAFMPSLAERGSLRTSMRGADRLSHIRIEDIDIISSRQKITEVKGLVLAGRTVNTPTTWENIEWFADHCPKMKTKPGVLFITGCNLLGRLLRSISKTSVRMLPNPRNRTIDVIVDMSMPGEYDLRLTSLDGSTLWHHRSVFSSSEPVQQRFTIDMSDVGQGMYAFMAITSRDIHSIPVIWLP
ncbi:MAG: PKD domain-containing protein [Ignavibacteria bacterium]|nr:PKD domain-containing protein [Ignavibacteria bacterium]